MKKIILIALSLISVHANTFCMEKDSPNIQQMIILKFNNNEDMRVPAEIARTSQFVSTMINLKLRSQQIKTEQEPAVDLKEMDKNYFNNQIYPYMKLIHGNNREQIITNLNNTNDTNALLELAKNANKLDLGKPFLQHVCTRTANRLSSDNQLDQFQNGLSYSIIDPDVRLNIKHQFNPSFKFRLVRQNIKNTAREYTRIPSNDFIWSCVLSPNKKYALNLIQRGSKVSVLGLKNLQQYVLDDHVIRYSSCCFTPDSKHALVPGIDGKIRIYDISTGELIKELVDNNNSNNNNNSIHRAVLAVRYTPKGDKILSSTWDGTLKIWDAQTYQHLKTFPKDTLKSLDCVYKIDFSNNKKNVLVSGRSGGGIEIGELKNNCLTMKKHIRDHFGSSCFVPNNNGILVTVDEGAKILDQKTGKATQTFADHTCKTASALPNSDGTLVVTTSWDGMVKIFSVKSGKCLTTLKFKQPGHKGAEHVVAHHLGSDDGKLILTHNNQVKIWNIFDPELIRELNNLSLDQKQLLTLMQRKPTLKIANHKHLTDIYKNLPSKTKEAVEELKRNNFNSTLDMFAIASSNPLLLAYSWWNRYYQGK